MEFLRHAWEFCNFQYVKFNVVYCVRIPTDDWMRWSKGREREREKEILSWVDFIFGAAFACCVHSPFLVVLVDLRNAQGNCSCTHIISLHCLEFILTAHISLSSHLSSLLSLSLSRSIAQLLYSHCAHGQNLFKIWSQHRTNSEITMHKFQQCKADNDGSKLSHNVHMMQMM